MGKGKKRSKPQKTPQRKSKRVKVRSERGMYYDEHFEECTNASVENSSTGDSSYNAVELTENGCVKSIVASSVEGCSPSVGGETDGDVLAASLRHPEAPLIPPDAATPVIPSENVGSAAPEGELLRDNNALTMDMSIEPPDVPPGAVPSGNVTPITNNRTVKHFSTATPVGVVRDNNNNLNLNRELELAMSLDSRRSRTVLDSPIYPRSVTNVDTDIVKEIHFKLDKEEVLENMDDSLQMLDNLHELFLLNADNMNQLFTHMHSHVPADVEETLELEEAKEVDKIPHEKISAKLQLCEEKRKCASLTAEINLLQKQLFLQSELLKKANDEINKLQDQSTYRREVKRLEDNIEQNELDRRSLMEKMDIQNNEIETLRCRMSSEVKQSEAIIEANELDRRNLMGKMELQNQEIETLRCHISDLMTENTVLKNTSKHQKQLLRDVSSQTTMDSTTFTASPAGIVCTKCIESDQLIADLTHLVNRDTMETCAPREEFVDTVRAEHQKDINELAALLRTIEGYMVALPETTSTGFRSIPVIHNSMPSVSSNMTAVALAKSTSVGMPSIPVVPNSSVSSRIHPAGTAVVPNSMPSVSKNMTAVAPPKSTSVGMPSIHVIPNSSVSSNIHPAGTAVVPNSMSSVSSSIHPAGTAYIPSKQDSALHQIDRFKGVRCETNSQPLKPLPLIPGAKLYSDTVKGSTTMVITDSMTGGVKANRMKQNIGEKDETIIFKRFPGGTAEEIAFYAQKPLGDMKPDRVVIVAGTNDLTRSKYSKDDFDEFEVVESVMKIGRMAREQGAKKIHVSGIIVRRGYKFQQMITKVNDLLYMACVAEDFIFMDQDNIKLVHVSSDGTHLNAHGTTILFFNILSVFNSFDRNSMDFKEDFNYAVSLS